MWHLAGKTLKSRLLLGTAHYPSLASMTAAIHASATQIVTLSIQRQMPQMRHGEAFWQAIKTLNCYLLPNTAGCRDANRAIQSAEISRELFNTTWIKLEIIGDEYNLQPDPFELIKAAKILVERGFEVFPYCTDDLVVCQKLVDVGCRILMPWVAPIGSGKGVLNPYALETLRHRLADMTLIVDAGIGKPSDAVKVMELGFDGVLLNTAIALAQQPVMMATAFRHAICAGHNAFNAGIMAERNMANPSTSLIDTPFWHQEIKK